VTTPTTTSPEVSPDGDAATTEDEKISFSSLGLAPALLSAIEKLGFESATPIQAEAIPQILAGRDIIGRARTGSGKTAAFGLPMLQQIAIGGPTKGVQALILTPTRELALQVADAMRDYARDLKGLDIVTVYGGSDYGPQLRALRRGVPVVVGTPGRVSDLVERGAMDLSGLKVFALDEADEMLRMGFIDAVEALLAATPKERQVVLFSATMPSQIRRVADRHLTDPVIIQVEDRAMSTTHITQHWLQVRGHQKKAALIRVLLGEECGTTLIFTRTRNGTSALADSLIAEGFSAEALHGGLNQSARERVLVRLRAEQVDLLVATDVAARGIDIDHITHVINYELPESAEQYVHRIGRTGRAGRVGAAISLVTPHERRRLFQMRSTLRAQIDQMSVPTIADIEQRRRDRLREKLQAVIAADEHTESSTWLATLEENGLTAEEVAVAALKLLSQQSDIAIPPDPGSRPHFNNSRPSYDSRPSYNARPSHNTRPSRDSGPSRESRPSRDQCNAVEVCLPIGRRRGVRPGDLVGALTNEAGITSSQIGRITIADSKSFIGLSEAAATQVLQQLQTVQIRGNDVRIERSQ
jgi:ATP-dependent RNA helicase DeaD